MARRARKRTLPPHVLRARLVALLVGAVAAAAVIAAVCLVLPAQSQADASTNYGYVYSGSKSASTSFAKATQTEQTMLVFGSSELSTPSSLVPEVPPVVFGEANYGLQLAYVGEAYDQSLWQTIALGAYDQAGAVTKKIVLIVAPGWFTDGGMDSSTFGTRFSYALYEQFERNENIDVATKAYVRQRLSELGISTETLAMAQAETPTDALGNAIELWRSDLKLRSDLTSVRTQGMAYPTGEVEVPDFAAWREQGLLDATAKSTNNDWGVEDSFWTNSLEPVLATAEGTRTGETYQDTSEYDDLACFLEVCRACGVEPLVVISPVMGPYYDLIGIDAQTRRGCYDRILEVCDRYGCAVADFSDREYEQYFLYDIVHFGWTGWVDVEEAIYDFYTQG